MSAYSRYAFIVSMAAVLAWSSNSTLVFAKSPASGANKEKANYWVGSFAKYVEIPGATRVGSETCVQCHTQVSHDFRHVFHALQNVECEDCHGPGSLHVDGNGDVSKIISFRDRSAKEANGACLSCHVQNASVRNWLAGPHATDNIRCTDCHNIHSAETATSRPPRQEFNTTTPGEVALAARFVPESDAVIGRRAATNDACLKCHPTQRAEGSLPYHHPLLENKMVCVDCHDPHGGPGGNNLRQANVNQLCLTCHAQYRGPFMYQHPPVNENCMLCHNPHGSPNAGMLTVSEPALCLQCHAGHHDGASLPLADRCTNCHGSIHGSDVPTPTGGSRFVDKGGLGVPGLPPQTAVQASNLRPASRAFMPMPAHAMRRLEGSAMNAPPAHSASPSARMMSPVPAHSSFFGPVMGAFPSAMGAVSRAFPGGVSAEPAAAADAGTAPDSVWGMYFTPGAYRFLNVTGYGGRVGQFDSLQQSEGGEFEGDYVSAAHHLSLLTRGTVYTGSDFDVAARFNAGSQLEAGVDLRSFVEQQDNYPFYAGIISPDIITTNGTPTGADFGVKRRLGSAYARVKVPKLPMHVFVKGDWQARVGETQLSYLDENIDNTCTTCHFTSRFQQTNYTTRDIGGGIEVNTGSINLAYEHDFSSFNDRLPYPSALLGPMLNEVEPGPIPVADSPSAAYYLDIPADSHYHADSLRLNWTPSPQLIFNGQATYRRMRDLFTLNPQNALDSTNTLVWHPHDRLRITADYRQQNLVNAFVPYFALYGDMSYHQHWAGVKADYELAKHLELETRYERNGVTRSNAFLWPQIYSFDNTDRQYVVPTSTSNTLGAALRYHPGPRWNWRLGYDWTGTHAPGYLVTPGSNNRVFGNVSVMPSRWLTFTNDLSLIFQNAFPAIQRRDRFYTETADASLALIRNWNLDLGYSYQQNNLGTYMAFQNDSAAGYVLDEPFVPYRELSQTYWIRSAYKLKQRLGFNMLLSHTAAHSGMLPDVNPNDYLLLGNGPLVQQGTFDPGLFAQALEGVDLGATQVSQVNVPQFLGQGKFYYLLPRGFDTGFLFSYGSYRDYTNPYLDGILRSYSVYFGRRW